MKIKAQKFPDLSSSVVGYFAVVCLFIALTLLKCRSLLAEHDVCFGDARVYARAIHAAQAGANSYGLDGVALPFVYPPFFLRTAVATSSLFPEGWGWIIYLGAACLGILAVPWLITAAYIKSEWLTAPVAMLLFTIQPRLVEQLMLLSGNIANPLYALVLIAGIPGIRNNRWWLFYVTVTFAALIKPPFLALLILPLLAGTAQLWNSTLPVLGTMAGYVAQRLFMPQAYQDFERAAYQQIVVKQDAGYGIYNYIVKVGHLKGGVTGPTIAHALLIGALVASLVLLRQYRNRPSVQHLWVPALLVTAILANPRMQRYDSDIAIIPAIYICIECLREPGGHLKTAIVAVSLTLLAALYTKPEMGMFLVLLSSLVLVIGKLARERLLDRNQLERTHIEAPLVANIEASSRRGAPMLES